MTPDIVVDSSDPPTQMCTGHEWVSYPCEMLLAVASEWSDHRDYDAAWT